MRKSYNQYTHGKTSPTKRPRTINERIDNACSILGIISLAAAPLGLIVAFIPNYSTYGYIITLIAILGVIASYTLTTINHK